MTLHTYELSPKRPGDFKILNALGRIHLAAWLTIPLMRTIMFGPKSTYPARIAKYVKKHTQALQNEDRVRYVVVIDDELPLCEDEGAGDSTDGTERPNGRVIAGIKWYIVPPTGPHPDVETQEAIDEHLSKSNKGPGTTALNPSSSSNGPVVDDGPPSHDALTDLFVAETIVARQDAMKTLGEHLLVDNLYTDPAYHGRGAGSILMRLATQHADELGVPSMLEASPAGMKVYERAGFVVLEGQELWFDLWRWANGGDRGVDFSERRLIDSAGERIVEDGWYAQSVMVRPAKSKGERVTLSDKVGSGNAVVV